jgi:hypothetical protein
VAVCGLRVVRHCSTECCLAIVPASALTFQEAGESAKIFAAAAAGYLVFAALFLADSRLCLQQVQDSYCSDTCRVEE